jgi:hypothetical protein
MESDWDPFQDYSHNSHIIIKRMRIIPRVVLIVILNYFHRHDSIKKNSFARLREFRPIYPEQAVVSHRLSSLPARGRLFFFAGEFPRLSDNSRKKGEM